MSFPIEQTLRAMAWNRAKGELNSMIVTFVDTTNKSEEEAFKKLSAIIEKFIEEVEGEGLEN